VADVLAPAAAHQLAARIEHGAASLDRAAADTLAGVRRAGGLGGVIAVDADGVAATPFTTEAMNRGVWRAGEEPVAWV
jgi:beta-aspartyl-peptidase (threonine type)